MTPDLGDGRHDPRDALPPDPAGSLCPHYHEAVELLGARWTGAIVEILLSTGPSRFTAIANAIPDLSDRLLSQRLRDLEDRGVITRHDHPGPPPHTRYALTPMGQDLQPAVAELKAWGRRWLDTTAPSFRRM
ncbi:MAG: helix-turn-helix transcriptional regulator [Conexibacter sp.]|jgi:DNA-binding HxlR family transcriptional regulator|nr:helix-turn-helix transcriptional regulator [Conexibacter sp.]